MLDQLKRQLPNQGAVANAMQLLVSYASKEEMEDEDVGEVYDTVFVNATTQVCL